MTVREMIKQLADYPMDSQVCDTWGSPIMFMRFASRSNNDVNLEPKSQTDLYEWLHEFFRECIEDGTSDYDACCILEEQGFTLEDLKNYREDTYKWALNSGFEWRI